MKESDLYLPVKRFLEGQQYEVKGEVQDCDVVARRGEEPPVVVELKLLLNLDVVLQAVERLALTSTVYIGVPQGSRLLKKRRRPLIKLMKMLGLGLMVIDPARTIGAVEVLLDPCEYKPRISKPRQRLLLAEFIHRVGDPNLGGKAKRQGIMTVYRQRALVIAGYLSQAGPTKAAVIAQAIGEPKTRNILYDNVYGWFNRLGQGVYELSPRGDRELPQWQAGSVD